MDPRVMTDLWSEPQKRMESCGMGRETKIAWADHTFNPWALRLMVKAFVSSRSSSRRQCECVES